MIIIKIQGGLGNQLFQYAFGRAVAEKNNLELGLDISSYTNQDKTPVNDRRRYLLNMFNIKAHEVSKEEIKKSNSLFKKLIRKIKGFFVSEKIYLYNKRYLEIKDGSYIIGFRQSEKYFKAIEKKIKDELTPNIPFAKISLVEWKDRINSSRFPISIHIRRGDYIKDKKFNTVYNTFDLNYYKESVDRIYKILKSNRPDISKKDLDLFLFSDDIDWVKNNLYFEGITNISHVSSPHLEEYGEIMLMKECKYNIIANSTFSWWAAWLNNSPEKIVICPKKWLNIPDEEQKDIFPDGWIKI